METKVSYLCFYFCWQYSSQIFHRTYYFTDEESQYQVDFDDDLDDAFDDDLDDLELDVVTDLGIFLVFELVGFQAVLLVED